MMPTLEGGGPCIVVYIVLDSLVCRALLESQGEGQLLGHGKAWVLPLGGLALVVDKVNTAIRKHAFLWGGGGGKSV